MQLYNNVKKIFINSKFLLILSILFFGSSIIYSGYYFIRSSNIMTSNKVLPVLSVFAYVFFAFLSFEFCRLSIKSNFDECLLSTSNGYKQIITAQIKLLNKLVFWFALFMLIVQYALYLKSGYHFHLKYIIYILLYSILNYYLIPFTAIMFGTYFALTSNRLNCYLLLVLSTLLGTEYFRSIQDMIYQTTNFNIYPLFNAFDIFTHDLDWAPNYSFGESILPNRWCACLFWCILLSGLILYKTSVPKNRKNFFKRIPLFALSILFLISVLIPSSKVQLEGFHPQETVSSDYLNYSSKDNFYSVSEKDADFAVLSYNADLTIFNKLHAKVEVVPDKTDLNEYIFTLYHQYNISKITDENNNKLKFEQNGDYVTVYNSGEINKLCFTYSGFSGTFYSNIQGIFLPAFFPYMPHAGWHEVYGNYIYNYFYFEESTEISIHINTPQKVYCNLMKTARNTFSGTGSGVTIIAGFYDEIEANGLRVIRPYMNPVESDDIVFDMINRCKDNDTFRNANTIIIMPHVNLSGANRYAEFSDHILSSQSLIL